MRAASPRIARMCSSARPAALRSEAKRALATALGADVVIDPEATDVVRAIEHWTGGRGADVVIDNLGTASPPAPR